MKENLSNSVRDVDSSKWAYQKPGTYFEDIEPDLHAWMEPNHGI